MDTPNHSALVQQLQNIVGQQHTLTDPARTLPYRQGIRFGVGDALAVVLPGTLLEQWQVLKACVAADVIVITQSANTGLTGGSTPDGNDYDRPIVIVSTRRLDGIQVIANGGVCNNSGGALIQRGPAYTQMAVYAQLDEQGELHLINHLGIELGDEPETILRNLQNGTYTDSDIKRDAGLGHDHSYRDHVREIDADTPARFNADPARHYEASGSAGRLMVFAVRLDSFPLEKNTTIAKIPFLPKNFSDRFALFVCKLLPQHLPQSIRDYRDRYEHHLILKMADDGIAEADAYLKDYFQNKQGNYFRCNAKEAEAAMLHRFAAAGAATTFRNVHSDKVENIVALDVALRRNDSNWFETLPESINQHFIHKMYYGHFFCHVFHQDYIAKKGTDCNKVEDEMLVLLDQRGAQYPAEHNVGHLYHAKPALKQFYRQLDPTNSFNPGIGKTSKKKYWA